MKKNHLRLGAFTLIAFIAFGCAKKNPSTGEGGGSISEGSQAPSWTLRDLDGKEVRLADYKGKIVVLDFWATWCPPCRAEIPGYVQLYKKYKDQGVVIIGVSLDNKGVDVVKKFVEQNDMIYPVAMADDAVVQAFGGIEAIPTTFLIDRDGLIRHRKVGAMETSDYEAILRKLL